MPGKLIYAGTMLNCSALQLQDKFSYARDKFKRNAHNSVDNAVKTAKIIQWILQACVVNLTNLRRGTEVKYERNKP